MNGSDATPLAMPSFTSGAANTAYLLTLDSHTNLDGKQDFMGAQTCADLNIHGKDDWYLPAMDELYVLYYYQDAIGDFLPIKYWSSNGTGTAAPYGSSGRNINFSNGNADTNTGAGTGPTIRCARKD